MKTMFENFAYHFTMSGCLYLMPPEMFTMTFLALCPPSKGVESVRLEHQRDKFCYTQREGDHENYVCRWTYSLTRTPKHARDLVYFTFSSFILGWDEGFNLRRKICTHTQ